MYKNFTKTKYSNCDYDCTLICIGCDKTFCEIKTEQNEQHDFELSEACCTNAGENFCHVDCKASYFGY